MAQTVTRLGAYTSTKRTLRSATEAGTANTSLTSTLAVRGNPYRLVAVMVVYSAAPTQTGVTVTFKSSVGSAYDAVLSTGSANAQYTIYIPTNDFMCGPSDQISVVAPAAGGVITATVQIIIEEM